MSEQYIQSSTLWCIVIGFIAAAMIIVSAAITKRNLGLGITAGIFQLIGSFAAQKMAHIFLSLDMFAYFEGTSSQVQDMLMNYYQVQIPKLLLMSLWSMLMLASWILTLVYIAKSMKLRIKAFPVLALVAHILRYVFIAPYDTLTAWFRPLTVADQLRADAVFYLATLLPLLLVLVSAIVTCAKGGIVEPAPAPVAEIEAEEL